MKSFRAKALNYAPALVFVAAITFAAPAPARAQGDTKDSPNRRPTFSSSRPPDPNSIRDRESSMKATERAAARASKGAPPEQAKLALAQIAEDYRHIQIINNRMQSATASAGAPDYKDVLETTKEIGKRAARLKSNLSLPAPEVEEKRWAYGHSRDAAQMMAALRRLDGLIMSFIMSPFFRNRDVLDARAGAKASGELDEIIELTRLISGDAGRLGKSIAER